MSREIDERIVEMRFDNKQFETATKETMSTLDKLKKALNLDSAAKGFDAIEKASGKVKFNKMQESLAALEKRFSAFGTFTARIIENAADDIYRTVKEKVGGAISYVTSAIKEGGLKRAMNMENAHFQLQALLKDEEKVQAVMADASKSVDGTAYSLDEAAKAASQFAASGIQAGDDMLGALRGIVGVSAMTNSQFEDIARIFTTVAGNGRLMGDQLLQLSGRGLNAASTLADFFNGVNDGSKQASDAVTSMVKSLTGGLQVSEADIREWVSKGKINFKMFSEAMTEAFADSAERANETYTGALSNMRSAFARIGEAFYKPLIAQNSEVVRLINSLRVRINDVKSALVFNEEVGNVNALAKQWTDFVLGLASAAADWVDNVDLTKPLEAFYYAVESVKHIGNGLLQILKPIGTAFQNVFHDALRIDNLVKFMEKVEEMTSKFTVTSKMAANLRRTFRGLFDIISLLIEGIVDFIKAIIPCEESTNGLADSVLGLTGDLGGMLSAFAKWVRESKTLNKVFDILTTGIRKTIEFVLNINNHIKNLIGTLRGIPEVNAFIDAMVNLFQALGKKATPYILDAKDGLKELGETVKGWDWKVPLNWLKELADKIQKLAETINANDGLKVASENAKSYMDRLKEAFSMDNLMEKVEGVQKTFEKITGWVQKTLGPVFEDFTFSNALAAAGGGGLIFALVKLSKAFESIAGTINGLRQIPKFFTEINKTLQAYQRDLNASALLKVAGAIAILAAVLIALSFVDTGKLYAAAGALSLVAAVIGGAIAAFLKFKGDGQKVESALTTLAKGIKSGIKKIASGIKWKMILQGVKDFGKAVAYIAGSIVAIALMYRKDPEATKVASDLVAMICTFLIAAVAGLSIVGEKFDKGMKAIEKAGIGMAAIGVALALIMYSIKELFALEIPQDYYDRLRMMGEILLAMTALEVIMIEVTKGSEGKIKISPILSIAAAVMVVVLALKVLFGMEIPEDAGIKLAILGGIFGSLFVMMMAMEKVAGKGKTSIKAAGTILAMCAFIVVIVAALFILTLIPFAKLITGVVALGIVLVALGAALWGASKVADDKAAKTVFNMAVVVGVIAASLAVLSLIKLPELAKACVALGAMLLLIAGDFLAISKISNAKVWASILAMVGVILAITISLVVLATQPWTGLLAGAVALGIVLEVFADVLSRLSSKSGIKIEKIVLFLLATTSLIPITASLAILANQPWEGLLAAGIAIKLVIGSFANLLEDISSRKGIKVEKIANFLLATVSLIPITASLAILANQPWEGLLAAGVAVSMVIATLALAFKVIASVNSNIKDLLQNIGAFLLCTLALVPIGVALAVLSTYDWTGMVQIAEAMSLMLIALAAVFVILVAIGPAASAAYPAILAFDVFIAAFALVLLALGAILENETTKRLLNGGMEVMGKLGTAIGDFVGNIIAGIGRGIGKALEGIGEGLNAFWENAEPFFDGVANIDPKSIEGVKMIAQAVLLLTAADFVNGIASFLGMDQQGLAGFGEQLEALGPHVKQYADDVAGIDTASVIASSACVKILAEVAAKLPRQAEWIDKVFGTQKTLADFAEELKGFGPAMKEYADSVEGIDPASVEASATAAKALSELANNLPKKGGKLQEWFGETLDLDAFGEQLQKFGECLVAYSQTVSAEGAINSEAIEASANAAQIMVDLAKDLPNTGGVVGWFMGNNDIDDFGIRLVSFGASLLAYSLVVAGVSTTAVASSATAAQMLVNLSNSLENSGGFISIWTGDNTLDEFGTQLVAFGESIASYYKAIRSINSKLMGNVTAEIAELGKTVQKLPTSNELTRFTEDMKNAGTDAVSKFMDAFKGSTLMLSTTVNGWALGLSSAFKKYLDLNLFKTRGKEVIDSFVNGFKGQQITSTAAMIMICKNITNAFQNNIKVNDFKAIGNNALVALNSGMTMGKNAVVSNATAIGKAIVNGIKSEIQNGNFSSIGNTIVTAISNAMSSNKYKISDVARQIRNDIYNAFKDLGEYAAEGLAKGLNNKQNVVSTAATTIAQIATNAARNKLEVKSPSRVWMAIGAFLSEGLSIGILDKMKMVAQAGEKIADTATDPIALAVDTINGLMQDDLGESLTLTPVLDLSQVQSGVSELTKLLNIGTGLSATYERTMKAASSFGRQSAAEMEQEEPDEMSNETSGPTFIQNNYSPKALSRIDIYRQTQSQFRMFERMVKQT